MDDDLDSLPTSPPPTPVEVKITQLDVMKLDVKPGQILVVNVVIADDAPAQLKARFLQEYGKAFRKVLDDLGLTIDQVPVLVSGLPVTLTVVDPPAPVLLPPATESESVTNLLDANVPCTMGEDMEKQAEEKYERQYAIDMEDMANQHDFELEQERERERERLADYPRGRPYTFDQETLAAMARQPQAPDDDDSDGEYECKS